MSQHDYDIENSDGASFRANLNAVLAAILSMNSGSGEPTATAAYMLWADTSTGTLKQRNSTNTGWVRLFNLGGPPLPVGSQIPFGGMVAPAGWAFCYGQELSRTGNPDLYATLCPVIGNFTVTVASPGVFSKTAHGMSNGLRVRLFSTGALPTGLTANTDYYVVNATADTWQLSDTQGGAAINTTGTQSGTHTVQAFPYGAGDGSTTFNAPDKLGQVDNWIIKL